jgi:hypothetical protein
LIRSACFGASIGTFVFMPYDTFNYCYPREIAFRSRECWSVLAFYTMNNIWLYARLLPLYTLSKECFLYSGIISSEERGSQLVRSGLAGALSGFIVGGRGLEDPSMSILRYFNGTSEMHKYIGEDKMSASSYLTDSMLKRHRLFACLYFSGCFLVYEFFRPIAGWREFI